MIQVVVYGVLVACMLVVDHWAAYIWLSLIGLVYCLISFVEWQHKEWMKRNGVDS